MSQVKMIRKVSNNRSILILIVIFTASILLRWPNMNHSLSRHHEWLSAHTLVTEKAWAKDGIANYYFSPVYKSGEQKELQADFFTVVNDKQGNTYYTSYPPFGFIAPYIFFKLFFMLPSFFGLQIFSLLIQFFTGLIIAKLLYELVNKKLSSDFYFPGIAAFVVYTFSTTNLWFCCNVYFADMLAQLFFATGIYLMYKVLYKETSKLTFILLFVNTFCFAYTEWLALLFVAFACLMLLIKFKVHVFKQKALWIMVSATALAMLVYFIQFSLIDGINSFIEALKFQFFFRTGTNAEDTSYGIYYLEAWKKIGDNFINGYAHTLLLLFLLGLNFLVNKIVNKNYKLNIETNTIIAFALLPCLLHALLLFNFTAMHDFSALKFSIFFALAIGILFSKFDGKKYVPLAGIFLMTLFVWRSYSEYLRINPPAENSDCNKIIGEKIKALRQKDEVVFVKEWGTPELVYYSEWIPFQQYTFEEAKHKLKEMKAEKALYINSEGMNLISVIRFNNKGDSTTVEKY